MKRYWWLAIPILLIISILTWLITHQAARPTEEKNNQLGAARTMKGVSFSPAAPDVAGLTDFYLKASVSGQAVSWVGSYQELGNPSSGAYSIFRTVKSKGLTPISIGVITAQDLAQPNFADYISRQFGQFATDNQPSYLGIGNEVDSLIGDTSPGTFTRYLSVFNTSAAAIKKVSPQTQVFPVFQLERLSGRKDGLFGGTAGAAHWSILDQFSAADLIVFTTYPGLIYKSPNDIPGDYYARLSSHTSKPVAFSETGWFRDGPAGWESSVQEQADFAHRFQILASGLKPAFIIWSFLYDQPAAPAPFTTMGLLQKGQETSPAWQAWLKALPTD